MSDRSSVSFAGLEFKNPVMLSAADHTHSLKQLKMHIDNGAAGIVPKTLCDDRYVIKGKRTARYMVFDGGHKPTQGKVGFDYTFMSRGGMMSEEEGWMDTLAEAQKYAAQHDAHIIGSLWGESDWMAKKAKEMEQIGLKAIGLFLLVVGFLIFRPSGFAHVSKEDKA